MAFVRFRFKFATEQAYKLLKIYGKDWSKLLSVCFGTQKTSQLYSTVVECHERLDKGFTARDVLPEIQDVNPKGAECLSNCHLLFDEAPFDLRSYIVAALKNPS